MSDDRHAVGPRPSAAGEPAWLTSSVLRLREDQLTWRVVDDVVIAIDGRTSLYLTTNRTGAVIWQRLIDGATVDDLVTAIQGRFEIDRDQALKDARAFLQLLQARGLLIVDR